MTGINKYYGQYKQGVSTYDNDNNNNGWMHDKKTLSIKFHGYIHCSACHMFHIFVGFEDSNQ